MKYKINSLVKKKNYKNWISSWIKILQIKKIRVCWIICQIMIWDQWKAN